MPLAIVTLLLGLSSPGVSFFAWKGAMHHLYETNNMVQVGLFLGFMVLWPSMWILGMFLGALNPLFGKTLVEITKESIVIRKLLFSVQWKHVEYANDEGTRFSVMQQTMQSPSRSSANQMMGRGTTTCVIYRLMIRDKEKQCVLYESYDESETVKHLHILQDAIR